MFSGQPRVGQLPFQAMSDQGGRGSTIARALLLALGFICFAIGAGYLLKKALGGSDLVEVTQVPGAAADIARTHKDALLWAILAAGGGLLMALGGLLAHLRAAGLESGDLERRDLEEKVAKREEELEKRDDQLEKREEELEQSHREKQALEHARRVEREWNRKLRLQISELQRSHGALGDLDDLPGLVLRMALELLDAEKGLLIAGTEDDEEHELRVRTAVGFDNDPSDSRIAKHFASEVLERDETIRQSAEELEGEGATPADQEIENLVAIPIYVQDEFSGVVICANSESYRDHDEEVLVALGDHAGAALENSALHGQLRTSYLATVRMLTEAIEAKDPFLRGHSEEVYGYVSRVADEFGIDASAREQLLFASLLHDVGKIGISERILLKPGPLSPEEYGVVQLHPRIGSRLIDNVPLLRPMTQAILHHHERFDGDGYPSGLRGEQIPLEARLIGVADAFSAMTSERPYRGRMSLDAACAELERCAGSQFDPQVVRAFVDEVRRDDRSADDGPGVAELLDDPEFAAHLGEEEPILGFGSYAVIDNLTLLYSHRYLHEVAAAEADRAAIQDDSFVIVLVELTNLDEINRRDGYLAGDRALQTLARAVQRAAVRCGGSACRYGGHRLALLAPHIGLEEGSGLAEEIEGRVGEGLEVRSAVSVWETGDDGDAVIDKAHALLNDVPA